jgi:hypothetical protein
MGFPAQAEGTQRDAMPYRGDLGVGALSRLARHAGRLGDQSRVPVSDRGHDRSGLWGGVDKMQVCSSRP